MHGGIDAHGLAVRVLVSDALVHLEEIAVALTNGRLAKPLDGIGEIEIHATSSGSHSAPLVADLLGCS